MQTSLPHHVSAHKHAISYNSIATGVKLTALEDIKQETPQKID
jgi:hypothetical protein